MFTFSQMLFCGLAKCQPNVLWVLLFMGVDVWLILKVIDLFTKQC